MKNQMLLALSCLLLVHLAFGAECEDAGGLCRKKGSCTCVQGSYDDDLACDSALKSCCKPNPETEIPWRPCPFCKNKGGRCQDPASCDCDGGSWNFDNSCGAWAPKERCCMPDANTDTANWVTCNPNTKWCKKSGGRCRDQENCDCLDGNFDKEDEYHCEKEKEICCFPKKGVDTTNWYSCDWEKPKPECFKSGGRCRDPTKCDCLSGKYDHTGLYSCEMEDEKCCFPNEGVNLTDWISCDWQKPKPACADAPGGGRCRNPTKCPTCLNGDFDKSYACEKWDEKCCVAKAGVDTSSWISCAWELRTCENEGGKCRRRSSNCTCIDGTFDNSATSCGKDEPEMDCCKPTPGVDRSNWYACEWEIPKSSYDCIAAGGRCRDPDKCKCAGGSYENKKQCDDPLHSCCLPSDGVAFPPKHIACPH